MHYHFNMTFSTNIIFLKCWKKYFILIFRWKYAYLLYLIWDISGLLYDTLSNKPFDWWSPLHFLSVLSTVVCHLYCLCSYLGKTGRGLIKMNSLSKYGKTLLSFFQSQSKFQAAFYSWQTFPCKTIFLEWIFREHIVQSTRNTERMRVEVNGHIKIKFSYKCTD